ncbi:MAG: hypothetical protein LBT78_00515, partial [Tannerella sp.]|nr:hypothetical protein [Tannerella sp.]
MKKKTKQTMIFLLSSTLICVATSLMIQCGKQPADRARQVASIVGKHVVRFTKPASRIPAKISVDAPLLGNGFTGVALSGDPDSQVFYVARNDFWRLKSLDNESYP